MRRCSRPLGGLEPGVARVQVTGTALSYWDWIPFEVGVGVVADAVGAHAHETLNNEPCPCLLRWRWARRRWGAVSAGRRPPPGTADGEPGAANQDRAIGAWVGEVDYTVEAHALGVLEHVGTVAATHDHDRLWTAAGRRRCFPLHHHCHQRRQRPTNVVVVEPTLATPDAYCFAGGKDKGRGTDKPQSDPVACSLLFERFASL